MQFGLLAATNREGEECELTDDGVGRIRLQAGPESQRKVHRTMGTAIKSKSVRKEDQLLTNLAELSKACPVHESNPEDCPLYPLRKLKPAERLRWLRALSEEDLSYLAAYHHVCLKFQLRQ